MSTTPLLHACNTHSIISSHKVIQLVCMVDIQDPPIFFFSHEMWPWGCLQISTFSIMWKPNLILLFMGLFLCLVCSSTSPVCNLPSRNSTFFYELQRYQFAELSQFHWIFQLASLLTSCDRKSRTQTALIRNCLAELQLRWKTIYSHYLFVLSRFKDVILR